MSAIQESHIRDMTEQQKESFEDRLLSTWVKEVGSTGHDKHSRAITNEASFLTMAKEARHSQKPLVFVAIGCQDWITPTWGEINHDALLGSLSMEQKRVHRFVEEFTSFIRSINSFGIPTKVHFTLSDIEALIHLQLHNMGVTIHTDNAETVMEENLNFFDRTFRELGIPVGSFRHSEVVSALTEVTDLQSLQERFLSKEKSSSRDFLDNLYRFDVSTTADHFVHADEVGPAWLTIQSSNFSEEVESLERATQESAPQLPVLSLFPNAGNWHSHTLPMASFPNREKVVANMLGLNQVPLDPEQWRDKAHRAKDERIIQLLSGIFEDEVTITNGFEKTLAVRCLLQVALGLDPLNAERNI